MCQNVTEEIVMTSIFEMNEKTGKIDRVASYSIDPKKALICYIMQSRKNFNTWEYPEHIEGIRESRTVSDHWYFDDIPNNRILASYPA